MHFNRKEKRMRILRKRRRRKGREKEEKKEEVRFGSVRRKSYQNWLWEGI